MATAEGQSVAAAAGPACEEATESLLVSCLVVSVSALRKKGHVLVELSIEGKRLMQAVTQHADIAVGSTAEVALPGAILAGQLVSRQKVAGEWSEGVIVDFRKEHSMNACGTLNQTRQDMLQEDMVLDANSCGSSVEDEAPAWQVLPRADEVGVASLPRVYPGSLHHVTGDASKAQYGKGSKIIAHVCNDQGRWGKGFVMAITDEWGKIPGKLYRKWHKAGAKADFGLGRVQLVQLTDKLALANIIGQTGIKTGSKGPPVRYEAIHEGLHAIASHAAKVGTSIHMPRIGAGLAGGEWARIEAILQSAVEKYDVQIYVYEYAA